MFSNWTNPKARIAHKCEACYRTIQPGETYHRLAGTDGGDFRTWKQCNHCDKLITLAKLDDYYEDGVGPEEIFEWVHGLVADMSIQELRWAVGWRKKWTRADGTLYPTPTRESHGY